MSKKLIVVTSPYAGRVLAGTQSTFMKMEAKSTIRIDTPESRYGIAEYKDKAVEILKAYAANDRSFVVGIANPLFLDAFNTAYMQLVHDKEIEVPPSELEGRFYPSAGSSEYCLQETDQYGIAFREIKEGQVALANDLATWKEVNSYQF